MEVLVEDYNKTPASSFFFSINASYIYSIIIVIILSYYMKDNNVLQKSKSNTTTTTTGTNTPNDTIVGACPNPNCVRCKNYKRIQQNAIRKLPHIIRYWRNELRKQNISPVIDENIISNTSYNNNDDNLEDTYSRILDKIIQGVNISPQTRFLNEKDYKELSAFQQYPTVLYIPQLAVHPICTHLHSKAYNVFMMSNNSNYHDDLLPPVLNNNQTKRNVEAITNDTISISSTNGPLHEILFQEYLQSQFIEPIDDIHTTTNTSTNDGVSYWQQNNIGTLKLIPDGNNTWEVLYLMNQGQWNYQCTKLFPKTMELIRNIPNIMQDCIFGNIFFSVLLPGTIIDQHCGPCNIRHRLHYTVYVPPECEGDDNDNDNNDDGLWNTKEQNTKSIHPILNVAGEEIKWKNGSCFVFDDSLVHFATFPKNNDYEMKGRVVLVVDLWHADLSDIEQKILVDLYPAVGVTSKQ